jgi:hypothetical protein
MKAGFFPGLFMQNSRFPLAVALVFSLGGMAASAQTTAPSAAPVVVVAVPTPAPAPAPKTTSPQTKDLTGDLAKASLAKQGITNPTRAQLAAERRAIADQRAKGMGWGQIAQSLGLNLGQVVSASNHARHEDRKESDEGKEKSKHRSENKEHKEHMKHSSSTTRGGDHGGAGKSTGSEHGSSHAGSGGGGGSHSSGGSGGGGKGK